MRPEPPDVEIVDDLVEQIPDVVHEGDVALDVPGHAEPHQDVEAEAVRRLDCGGIEIGDRLRQSVAASFDLVSGGVGQHAQDVVGRVDRDPAENVRQATRRR